MKASEARAWLRSMSDEQLAAERLRAIAALRLTSSRKGTRGLLRWIGRCEAEQERRANRSLEENS